MDGLRTIGILLFADVEELDAVGPWEVLAAWTKRFPEDGWEVLTFSDDGGLVNCAKGMTIKPDHSLETLPPLGVLIYPGGQGTRTKLTDEGHLQWVRSQFAQTSILASVCTGSLVLAAAGLLHDRPATTHWGSLDTLAQLDPTVLLRPSERFVDTGDIITSAGVSAGIDMALHLVSRLAGVEHAREVRRYIQYDPAPPV